jgi:hypothetical protein
MKRLDWRIVPDDERWLWWEGIWQDVCELKTRYELPVRCGWWAHATQLEALAALSAWTSAYDDGEWDDPPGKLSMLLDLDRIGELLRDGNDPFYPDRHRHLFELHLVEIGCAPPSSWPP